MSLRTTLQLTSLTGTGRRGTVHEILNFQPERHKKMDCISATGDLGELKLEPMNSAWKVAYDRNEKAGGQTISVNRSYDEV